MREPFIPDAPVRCRVCGNAEEVVWSHGKRQSIRQCRDITACWARQDTAHGLSGTIAQQHMAERLSLASA